MFLLLPAHPGSPRKKGRKTAVVTRDEILKLCYMYYWAVIRTTAVYQFGFTPADCHMCRQQKIPHNTLKLW